MTHSISPISADMARTLISAAAAAPSSHNTQPWLFAVREHGIDLLADRRRTLPVNDPNDRELTISCGCALFNLRVAAAAAGMSAQVALCPEGEPEDLLARVDLVPADCAQPLAVLHTAIARRRTVRQRFAAEPLDARSVDALAAAAAQEDAMLCVLATKTQRQGAAELAAQGDAIQWANPSWRRELAAWMHPRRSGDGLAVPALAAPIAQAVVRTFDMGEGVAAKDNQLARESPLLTVFSSAADTVVDWLRCGQALQRALLEGVLRGLQASYLNQPIQVASLRARLQHLADCKGTVQLLVRWGKPTQALPETPRRPVAEVMVAR